MAASAGRKSSTSTFLFSFFLSFYSWWMKDITNVWSIYFRSDEQRYMLSIMLSVDAKAMQLYVISRCYCNATLKLSVDANAMQLMHIGSGADRWVLTQVINETIWENDKYKWVDTVLKEAAYFSQTMWRKLLDILVMAKLGVISTYSYNLVILFTLQQVSS